MGGDDVAVGEDDDEEVAREGRCKWAWVYDCG